MTAPTITVGDLGASAVVDRTFAWSGEPTDVRLRWFAAGLSERLTRAGYAAAAAPGPDVALVLHLFDPDAPRPYRRRSAPTFVVAVAALPEHPDDLLRSGYPLIVRNLANLLVLVTPPPATGQGATDELDLREGPAAGSVAHFVTPEQGTYSVATSSADDPAFFDAVLARIEPLASSRLVITNEFARDLPDALADGDDATREITRAGKRLDALDLLPAVFPLDEILTDRDRRHLNLLYGIGGLSYGNLSARRPGSAVVGDDAPEFWMSASGVDKSSLVEIGRDVMLVTGFDEPRSTMRLRVPAAIEPRRVSVDAIEHWMIYREHPDVGAILHVHAWIPGTPATDVNYPCGTVELAQAVAELVRAAPDPSRAVVGQRNHGLTITGHSLDEIFERIDGRIVQAVPMD